MKIFKGSKEYSIININNIDIKFGSYYDGIIYTMISFTYKNMIHILLEDNIYVENIQR